MADAIQFDLLEEHKENIQQLPTGRSAKALARVLSPRGIGHEVSLDATSSLNAAIRQEYENELLAIDESDDPLDIYVRYVKWTINTYPSAQSTPQSQLLPLLERATKAFLSSSEYRGDARYLKLWLQYIHLFSETPRETFTFLARHGVGEKLALFYEEFAAWLEGAGRWQQADEVYRLGLEREARPAERLSRKYREFQQRFEARPTDCHEPTSPALPKVRAALAAKIDPFAPASTEERELQQQRPTSSNASKSKKPKMAIFSDAESQPPPPATSITNGWDSIGSMKERKKENTIEAQPWAGQTLKAGKRVGTTSKMEVFKDPVGTS